MFILETIEKGGAVMWPIVILLLAGIGMIIERAIFFYLTNIDYKEFKEALLMKIKKQNIATIDLFKKYISPKSAIKKLTHWLAVKKWNHSPYVKIASGYIANVQKGTRSREEALRRIGSEEIEKMERNFKGLSSISHISPLLGLLGTVVGIISAFNAIAKLGGQVDVTALAGGIWAAMLTTAAGLIVAIPTQLGFLFFEKMVDTRANRMSYIVTYLNEELFDTQKSENDDDNCNEPQKSDNLIKHEYSGETI